MCFVQAFNYLGEAYKGTLFHLFMGNGYTLQLQNIIKQCL